MYTSKVDPEWAHMLSQPDRHARKSSRKAGGGGAGGGGGWGGGGGMYLDAAGLGSSAVVRLLRQAHTAWTALEDCLTSSVLRPSTS